MVPRALVGTRFAKRCAYETCTANLECLIRYIQPAMGRSTTESPPQHSAWCAWRVLSPNWMRDLQRLSTPTRQRCSGRSENPSMDKAPPFGYNREVSVNNSNMSGVLPRRTHQFFLRGDKLRQTVTPRHGLHPDSRSLTHRPPRKSTEKGLLPPGKPANCATLPPAKHSIDSKFSRRSPPAEPEPVRQPHR